MDSSVGSEIISNFSNQICNTHIYLIFQSNKCVYIFAGFYHHMYIKKTPKEHLFDIKQSFNFIILSRTNLSHKCTAFDLITIDTGFLLKYLHHIPRNSLRHSAIAEANYDFLSLSNEFTVIYSALG